MAHTVPVAASQSGAGRPSGAPRRGLVLGAGGVLGAAWTVGALCALEEVHGVDVRTCELLIGTSAGSVLAALIGGGVSATQLRAHQEGLPLPEGPLAAITMDYDTATGGTRPGLPSLGPGSAAMVVRNAHRLRRMPPTAVLAGLLPAGRGSLHRVAALVEAVSPDGWVDHPGVRIATMDYDTGRRVVFGAPGAPEARLDDAVRASCAIPGWYAPVRIGGHRYVDGGACSATSADLAAGHGLDELYVLAPMVSFDVDHPRELLTRLERRWRLRVTRRCLHEVAKVHRQGTHVTVLGPGADDLAVFGANAMDVRRRAAVLETSLRTSRDALLDPGHLPAVGTPRLAETG